MWIQTNSQLRHLFTVKRLFTLAFFPQIPSLRRKLQNVKFPHLGAPPPFLRPRRLLLLPRHRISTPGTTSAPKSGPQIRRRLQGKKSRMGNCCGSQSALDDNDGPTQPRPVASRPQKPRKPTGPGYTLGGPPPDTSGGVDPRTAAAIAAQVHIFICEAKH